ncbi:MAG: FKBP-type peptidyl-prolyl cis-trans isomerase [Bacteroidales bacterium]|nr:FKBP-type peptidyl-prolyl cis-trans isomerase [Bacteroidales bacterium]
MKTKFFFYSGLIFIVFIASCKQQKFEGYSQTDSGIYYKLISLGDSENKTAEISNYITVDLAYRTISDSLFFNGTRKFKIEKPSFAGEIDECFTMMAKDDSASFIINAYNFFTKTIEAPVPDFLLDDNLMKVDVKLLRIQTEKEFEMEKQEFLTWIKDFEEYEQVALNHYLEKNLVGINPSSSGMIKTIVNQGSGEKVKRGDTLVLHFEGKFLDGKIFDSTRKRNSAFEFVFGQEYQVIKGLEEAIATMKEGEFSIFIMPSEIGFGHKGSSTGYIPPFTSLIFEVELISVK